MLVGPVWFIKPHEVLAPFSLIRWLVPHPPVCFPSPPFGFPHLSALLEARKTVAAPVATLVCFPLWLLALQQLSDEITRPFVTPSGVIPWVYKRFYALISSFLLFLPFFLSFSSLD